MNVCGLYKMSRRAAVKTEGWSVADGVVRCTGIPGCTPDDRTDDHCSLQRRKMEGKWNLRFSNRASRESQSILRPQGLPRVAKKPRSKVVRGPEGRRSKSQRF